MVQLALLLLGVKAVKRHWLSLAVIGAGWGMLGLGIDAEALEGIQAATMHWFGILLVIEGVVTLLTGVLSNTPGRLWIIKTIALIVPGLVVMETPWRDVVLISVVFGVALMLDGGVRIASTLLLRFPGWRVALLGGGIEVVLAVLALTPWPVSYESTIPFCVGVALMLSGWTVLRSALLLRRLPPDAPITSLPLFERERGWYAPILLVDTPPETAEHDGQERLSVLVWTPLASAADPVRRPLLDRYIAAVDRHGAVSTGHAALELWPDLYISHYRAQERDRSRLEFIRDLNAGAQNDVPGRFLPSYAEEAAEWCEATARVVFRRFNAEHLRAHWFVYRQDATYNLTNRNCSVAVAVALDAALEGVLGSAMMWPPLLRLVIHPDLHLATLLRKRARTMTWTPGLVLDYARAMRRVVEPPEMSWVGTLRRAVRHYRRIRRMHPAAQQTPAV